LTVGLDDLRGLFQRTILWFYDIVICWSSPTQHLEYCLRKVFSSSTKKVGSRKAYLYLLAKTNQPATDKNPLRKHCSATNLKLSGEGMLSWNTLLATHKQEKAFPLALQRQATCLPFFKYSTLCTDDNRELHLYNLRCCITYTFAWHIHLTVQRVLMLTTPVNQVYSLDCEFPAGRHLKQKSEYVHTSEGRTETWMGKEGRWGHTFIHANPEATSPLEDTSRPPYFSYTSLTTRSLKKNKCF